MHAGHILPRQLKGQVQPAETTVPWYLETVQQQEELLKLLGQKTHIFFTAQALLLVGASAQHQTQFGDVENRRLEYLGVSAIWWFEFD
jgi:hypothetical protein